MGVSGEKIIVPGGTHTITAVMPGFEEITEIHEIPTRIFGSLFFPRITKIEFTLETVDPAAAFTLYAREFAEWSFGGEPTDRWQIPQILSEGAYRIGRSVLEGSEEQRGELQQILLAASLFADTKAAIRDLIRAKMLLDNYGNSPSPQGIIGSIKDILGFLSENPGSAAWLFRVLPDDAASIIGDSGWFHDEFFAPIEFFPDSQANSALPRLQLAGLNFIGMNAGKFHNTGYASTYKPSGNSVYIDRFLISEFPVSRSLFETFLFEKPEWKEHYTDYFTEEIAFIPGTIQRDIITGITWYAADAFCKWLSERLPSSLAGMEVRLPTENEWGYASLGISSMQGTGLEAEWCADPYVHLRFITAPEEKLAVGSPERSIRGKTAMESDQVREPAIRRGSLPPDLSSPFVTFRPVIAYK